MLVRAKNRASFANQLRMPGKAAPDGSSGLACRKAERIGRHGVAVGASEEKAMSRDDPKPDEELERSSSGGRGIGSEVKRVTRRTVIRQHKVGGSEDNAEYIVRSKSSGRIAAHRPGPLKRT